MRLSLLALLVAALAAAVGLSARPVAAAGGPAIAICGTFSESDEEATAQAALETTGVFSTIDTLDCADGTPSLSTLQNYDAVYAFPDASYADFDSLSQVLAQYVDGGGRLVLGQWGFESCCGTWWGTELDTGGYLPYTNPNPGDSGGTSIDTSAMQFDDTSSPLLAGVNSVGSSEAAGVDLAPGATSVAHWDDGTSAVAYKGNVVALNIFLDGGPTFGGWSDATGDWLRLLVNALDPGNSLGSGEGTFAHIAVCTAKPVLRVGDGSLGRFADVDVLLWQSAKGDASSDYFGSTPAVYVAGYGLMCGLSDVATYGGNPSQFTLAGYHVDLSGMPAPTGTSDAAAGAYYPYYTHS